MPHMAAHAQFMQNDIASPSLPSHENASKATTNHPAPRPPRNDSFNNYGGGQPMRSTPTKLPHLLQTLSDASDASEETLSSTRQQPQPRLNGLPTGDVVRTGGEESGWHMRHGFNAQYTVDQLRELSTVCHLGSTSAEFTNSHL